MFCAVCLSGCRSQYSMRGNSSRSCCALDVECDASSPGQIEAGISIVINSSGGGPETNVSGNIASRLCVTRRG